MQTAWIILKLKNMRYIVIEDFNDNIAIVSDPETGEVKVFDTEVEAQEEADKCQHGVIVNLGK